jgi:hypothetical protein
MSSREWARAALASVRLHRVPLKTLNVHPETSKGNYIDALEFNVASLMSALKLLAHHATSANFIRICLNNTTLGAADLPVGGLDWPELRAAEISLN